MKKIQRKYNGFTLIELMVVIAIIAILSVVGITVFSGVQKNARDARRRADIDAIASALEVAKGSSTTYSAVDGTKFANGAVPNDSANAAASMTYCLYYRTDSTAVAGSPTAAWTTAACPSVTAPNTLATGPGALPATSPFATNWTVCASLETTTAPTVYCKSNSQ